MQQQIHQLGNNRIIEDLINGVKNVNHKKFGGSD